MNLSSCETLTECCGSIYDKTACPDIEAHRRYPGHADLNVA